MSQLWPAREDSYTIRPKFNDPRIRVIRALALFSFFFFFLSFRKALQTADIAVSLHQMAANT